MRRNLSSLSILLLIALSLALKAEAKSPSIGKAVVTYASPQTCALEAKTQAGWVRFCTATLVEAKTLVTAAHCKSPEFDASKENFRARCKAIGEDKNGVYFAETHELEDFSITPDRKDETSSIADVAYVKLKTASDETPATLVAGDVDLQRFLESAKFVCAVEGMGVSVSEVIGQLRGDTKRVVSPTAYRLELGALGEHLKSNPLFVGQNLSIDFAKLSQQTQDAMIRLQGRYKEVLAEIDADPSLSPEHKKTAKSDELRDNVYPIFLTLLNADPSSKLHHQSLPGDSGGGVICLDTETNKRHVVAVTSRMAPQKQDFLENLISTKSAELKTGTYFSRIAPAPGTASKQSARAGSPSKLGAAKQAR